MTQFDTWLKTLARARKGPVTMPDAVRGHAYTQNITVVGDWTEATLTGSIRVAPDSDTALAVFTVGAPSLSSGNTTWIVSLTGTQTSALPIDGNADGEELFVYDFLLNNQRLFGGIFPLSGHVTEPA